MKSTAIPAVDRPAVVMLTSRLGAGGAERHTITLANNLSDRFRVAFAYLKPEEDMISLVQRERLLALQCLRATKRLDWRAVRRLAQFISTHGATTVLCANSYSLMYAQLARLISPEVIAVIQVYHSTKERTWKERIEMLLMRPLYRHAEHLIFVSHAQQLYWQKRNLGAKQIHMIHNGVDLQYFNPALYVEAAHDVRRSLGWESKDRVVGICAVMRPEKAHLDLLRAVAAVRKAGRLWKILIIGDGPLRAAIEREATSLGLQDHIHITGFLTDVRAYLAACDVVALVSRTEAFSIAALEAMAMGKPMIMSDVGGAKEQVQHGKTGYLFASGHVSGLAGCLAQCWDTERMSTMGRAARRRVEQEFSEVGMLDKYAELISSASTAW